MATPAGVFIYIGTYPSEAGARADYDVVKDIKNPTPDWAPYSQSGGR